MAALARVLGNVSEVVPALVSPVSVVASSESSVAAITVGVITAAAVIALAAPITVRRVTRDFARWAGEEEGVGGTVTVGSSTFLG
ncbi:hypothetical protein GCM10010344_58350 [Streptomyces bluensis]|nr:hypothetical protein GCM10010344_58350 [Streptomyces bluensis]